MKIIRGNGYHDFAEPRIFECHDCEETMSTEHDQPGYIDKIMWSHNESKNVTDEEIDELCNHVFRPKEKSLLLHDLRDHSGDETEDEVNDTEGWRLDYPQKKRKERRDNSDGYERTLQEIKCSIEEEGSKSDIKKASVSKEAKKTISETPESALYKEFLKKFRVLSYHGTPLFYEDGAYIDLSYKRFQSIVEKLAMNQRLSSVDHHPTSREIQNAYQHLCAFLDENADVSPEWEDRDNGKICFYNGVYDCKTGEFVREHSPDYFILFRINANYIPRKKVFAPIFDKFLRSQCSESDFKAYRSRVYEMIGYLMISDPQAKCFFYLGTAPDSGKSVLAALLTEFYDEFAISTLPLSSFSGRFAFGDITSKAISISMEICSGKISPDAVVKLKGITGDRRVYAEPKYVQASSVIHHCKYVFGGNEVLELVQPDEAFWNRVVLIPFMSSVDKEKQDKHLLQKLIMEKDEIATLAAHFAYNLIENNYFFTETESIRDTVSQWKGDYYHPITQFIRNNCILKEEAYTFSEELYEAYCAFCDGKDIIPMNQTGFSEYVRQRFGVKSGKRRKEGKPLNGFHGICLKDVNFGVNHTDICIAPEKNLPV